MLPLPPDDKRSLPYSFCPAQDEVAAKHGRLHAAFASRRRGRAGDTDDDGESVGCFDDIVERARGERGGDDDEAMDVDAGAGDAAEAEEAEEEEERIEEEGEADRARSFGAAAAASLRKWGTPVGCAAFSEGYRLLSDYLCHVAAFVNPLAGRLEVRARRCRLELSNEEARAMSEDSAAARPPASRGPGWRPRASWRGTFARMSTWMMCSGWA